MIRRGARVLVLTVGALLLPAGAMAQTLEEALVSAYTTNPTLLAQRAKLRASDEGVPQALSGWRPSVEFTGDYGNQSYKVNTSTGTERNQHRDPRSVEVELTQSIFAGGKTFAQSSKAENVVKAERARLISAEQEVILLAVQAYVDVVRDKSVLELNVNNEQVLTRQLEATRDRFEVGEITRTDVHQAEARVAGATADRIKAEGDLEASRAKFLNVIGLVPGTLTDPEVAGDLPADRETAEKIARTGYPDVIAAEYDEQASRDNVDQVRGDLLPSVDLSVSASRSFDSSSEHSRIDSYTGKATLTVPIYEKGAVYSRMREAKQLVARDRQGIDKARRAAVEAASRSWESYQTTRARIKSFNAQISAAEVALDGVQREAAVGSRTVLDVLDAEQELLNAKVNLAKAHRDEVVAAYELRKTVGQLTAKHLNLPVKAYDPLEHYEDVKWRWFGTNSDGQGDDEAAPAKTPGK